MLRLKCEAMQYAWGRLADSSEVAQLAAADGQSVDKSKPYAELWMGTHPSGPSILADTGITLKQWIEEHPAALGERVRARFGDDLPFLFKVLSVETALSIQSHPDKKLAERLHAERPHVYKDSNHKPEMALSLTDFEALCGFVQHEELCAALEAHPELRACVGEENVSAALLAGEDASVRKDALKQAFTALMTCDSAPVAEAVTALAARLTQQASTTPLTPKEQLVIRLNQQYPADVGVLSVFFLNYIQLPAGQSIALPANVPHAYVSGQLVECMATSDNVIRAGLTPKLRDTDVLCASLTYEQGTPDILKGTHIDQYTRLYQPPFAEFQISRVVLPQGATTTLPRIPTPRILLIDQGMGHATAHGMSNSGTLAEVALARGGVFFVPAEVDVCLVAAGDGLAVWEASCNVSML